MPLVRVRVAPASFGGEGAPPPAASRVFREAVAASATAAFGSVNSSSGAAAALAAVAASIDGMLRALPAAPVAAPLPAPGANEQQQRALLV